MDSGQIIVAVLTGLLASVVTTLMTPRLQHFFWKKQKLAELQFATIKEAKSLLAEYLAGHIAKVWGEMPDWKPTGAFWKQWQSLILDLQTLFSTRAWKVFKEAEKMMNASGTLGLQGGKTVDQFMAACNRAVVTLYKEIGLDLPEPDVSRVSE